MQSEQGAAFAMWSRPHRQMPCPVTKPGVKSQHGICRCSLGSVEAFQVSGS
jgi:hypothetical protein